MIFNLEDKATCASDDLTKWSVAGLRTERKALTRDANKGFHDSAAVNKIDNEINRRVRMVKL